MVGFSVGRLRSGEGSVQWGRVEVLDQLDENLRRRAEDALLVAVEEEPRFAHTALSQWQRFEQAFLQLPGDQVAWQPGEAQAAADEGARGGQAANRPALFRAQPAGITRLQAAAIAGHH